MQIKDQQDAVKIFQELMKQNLPEVIRQTGSNFRTGVVDSVNTTSRQIDVRMDDTGELLTNLKYYKGGDNVLINDRCLIISVDRTNTYFIVGIY